MSHCLIDPRSLLGHDFGAYHPFKIHRLGLAFRMMDAYGLVHREDVSVLAPRMATDEEAMAFHTSGYLECLRLADAGLWTPNLFSHGLGSPDNPVFPGVMDWAMSVAGGSLVCAEGILDGEVDRAFNLAGGLHHAMPSSAAGFCHINDAALAVQALTAAGRRVVYVDIDAHHGDGVEHAFRCRDDVLTVSIHQTGRTIFPGTGFAHDRGEGPGEGYTVNIPLLPGAGDDAYDRAFRELILPVIGAFGPDVMVTQLGCDAVLGDVVANLRLTLRGFEQCLLHLRSLDLPWVGLGGGGYDVGNVARAWTLAWGVMLDQAVDDEIPSAWMVDAAQYDVAVSRLRGAYDVTVSPEHVLKDLDKTLTVLRESALQGGVPQP